MQFRKVCNHPELFERNFGKVPFTFKLTKKTKSDLILIITIGIIILACLLCAILVYFVSKKISKNARLRQRYLIELAMARQNGERASSNGEEVHIC